MYATVVNEVVKALNHLRIEAKNELADRIAKHLIETWKKQGLDAKIPQFIEYIERSMKDPQAK